MHVAILLGRCSAKLLRKFKLFSVSTIVESFVDSFHFSCLVLRTLYKSPELKIAKISEFGWDNNVVNNNPMPMPRRESITELEIDW
jgi:hypothetical protein